jgi:hypothetical protein
MWQICSRLERNIPNLHTKTDTTTTSTNYDWNHSLSRELISMAPPNLGFEVKFQSQYLHKTGKKSSETAKCSEIYKEKTMPC